MPRNVVDRVTETIAEIRADLTSNLPQNILNDIATAVGNAYPRATPVDKANFNTLSGSISVKHNIAPGLSRANKTENKQRRMIALLWMAMTAGYPGNNNRAMTLASGQLGPELVRTLKRAAVYFSPAGATHVFNTDFVPNPLAFATANRIRLFGDSSGAILLTNPNAHTTRNVVNHYFAFDPSQDMFIFAVSTTQAPGASHQFAAISVPAVHWSDVPGRGITPSPGAPPGVGFGRMRAVELAGADWVFTTQLSGCSVCYHAQGGNAYMSHVLPHWPNKPVLTGSVLATQLCGNDQNVPRARFHNVLGAPAAEVFGPTVGNANVLNAPGHYTGAYAYVFGHRVGNAWEIYVQEDQPAGPAARRLF